MNLEIFFEPFFLRALAAGIGVALVAGTLGCFVVWRKMAYFGDSLAHSALLGVALGLAIGISTSLGILIVCSTFAVLLLWLQQKKFLATDTLLGILAHGALSFGVITISFLERGIDLHSYLFGDILTVMPYEVVSIYVGASIVFLVLSFNWSSLLLMNINEDLALAENVRTFFSQLLLLLLMTIVVAVSIRIVGLLLITSLLIIPAATARQLARSPEAMAIAASFFGILAVIGGLCVSLEFDTPSGPSIVATSAILFVLLFPIFNILSNKR